MVCIPPPGRQMTDKVVWRRTGRLIDPHDPEEEWKENFFLPRKNHIKQEL